MRQPRVLMPILAGLMLGTCQADRAPAPTQNRGGADPEVITLRVGEHAFVNEIEIRFGAVLRDNRCPVDVVCIAAGDAVVELGVGPARGTDGPTHRLVLNALEAPRSGEVLGLRLTLLEVSPAPVSNEPIPPDGYQIKLRVEPAGE